MVDEGICEGVGDQIEARRADWRLDDPGVAENFDGHVSKSTGERRSRRLVPQRTSRFNRGHGTDWSTLLK